MKALRVIDHLDAIGQICYVRSIVVCHLDSLFIGVHIAMLTTMLGLMDLCGWKADDLTSTVWMYVGLTILYYVFANLTYMFVERPYIRLRDVKLGHTDVRSGNVAMVVEAVELQDDKSRHGSAGVGQPG